MPAVNEIIYIRLQKAGHCVHSINMFMVNLGILYGSLGSDPNEFVTLMKQFTEVMKSVNMTEGNQAAEDFLLKMEEIAK